MLKFDAALKSILDSTKKINSEYVRLKDALGRVLAQDAYADSDLPAFDNSAMDGYAVRPHDIAGASKSNPKILDVICDIKAGDVPKKILGRNQAMRIMTGAPVPKGADSVVMVECTKVIGTKPKELVEVYRAARFGENIRVKAEDIKKGELVIPKGQELGCAHVAILASLGISKVRVARRPRIAFLATGDELVDADKPAGPGKIRSSNTYILHSQIVKCGCIPKDLGIAKDDPVEIEKKISKGLNCDIIITSGGVSVGEYDFVRDALAKIGKIKFWRVAIRPGKPMVFGKIKKALMFGLPGNPVSGIISFEMFVRPAILKMQGQKEDTRKEAEAVSETDINKNKGVRHFLRAKTRWVKGRYLTKLSGPQGSAMLKSMSLANSLIILEEGRGFVKKGTKVKVRFLD